jgi:DNA primase
MNIDDFLGRLDKVRAHSGNSWTACCPAHLDKDPSLTISYVDDGRILIHCFAGCDPISIMHALGLDLEDLFPERLEQQRYTPLQRKFNASAVLEALRTEVLIVALCSRTLLEGKALEPQDHERLMLAASRIEDGGYLANGDK